MKLTPWFSHDLKPVRKGMYSTRFSGHVGFSYWNGRRWHNQGFNVQNAMRLDAAGAIQRKEWRGLVKPV
jgi:hypothetical protein